MLAGCGRELPDRAAESVPAGGDEVGAFQELGDLSGRVETDGSPLLARFLTVSAREFRAEEPKVKVTVGRSGTADAVRQVCAGKLAVASADRAMSPRERKACARVGGAVALHVADRGDRPLYLYATGESLLRFEVEAFLQFVLDNEEQLARAAGVEPLTLDELQETTTVLEKALAGVG